MSSKLFLRLVTMKSLILFLCVVGVSLAEKQVNYQGLINENITPHVYKMLRMAADSIGFRHRITLVDRVEFQVNNQNKLAPNSFEYDALHYPYIRCYMQLDVNLPFPAVTSNNCDWDLK